MSEKLQKSIDVKLDDVRLSFFNGFTPQERRDDNTEELIGYNYSTSILIPKSNEELEKKIRRAMTDVAKALWGSDIPKFKADQKCLRDGEPADEETGERSPLWDGYEGSWYISVNTPIELKDYKLIEEGKKQRPVSIIGPRKGANGKFKELEEGDEFAPYSGCYANVIISIYAYAGDPKKKRPPRINASLKAVQFKRHGEAFGAKRIDVNSAFDEEDDDDLVSGSGGGSASMDEDDDLI